MNRDPPLTEDRATARVQRPGASEPKRLRLPREESHVNQLAVDQRLDMAMLQHMAATGAAPPP